jgi:arsenite methyltransferase
VAEDALTPKERAERGSYVGCIAGALSFSEYRSGLAEVGLTDVSVTSTHLVTEGMHSAIIKATKPMAAESEPAPSELPLAVAGCCGGGGCC